MSTYAMLNDLTKCIGCRACQVACKEWNELEYETTSFTNTRDNPPRLNSDTYTRIEYKYLPDDPNLGPSQPERWYYRRHMCNHCEEPACVSACPVGALKKSVEGAVVYLEGKCIGCRYCMLACPFAIPKYEWDQWKPFVRKCTMCFDRIKGGEQPACSKACLTGAIKFGPRDETMAEARLRIVEKPGRYQPQVYGETEVGGTSVLFLSTSAVALPDFGFRTDLGDKPYPDFTWAALSKVPALAIGVGVLMSIIYFITHRKMPEAGKKA